MKTISYLPKLQLLFCLVGISAISACNRNEKVNAPNFALEFDGVNGHVIFENSESLNPKNAITISMWVYLADYIDCNDENNWRGLVYKGWTWGSSGYDVILEEDLSLSWDIATVGGSIRYFSSPSKLLVGRWSYLTFVYDASISTAKIYFNGKLISGEYGSHGSGDIIPNSFGLRLNTPAISGCTTNAGNFPGIIDEMSIWNIALTGSQIMDNMNQPLTGDEAGLISYWNFDEGNNSVAYDLTGKNDGALYGGVSWTTTNK